ncbi:MAG: FmdB family zinc ribbon protein [Acidimicrobiales bacterium]
MPTYEYACTSCGHRFDVVQSFSDDPLTTCPECGAPLRKVFSPVGIVLKGSGFYKTDSRTSGGKGTAGSDRGAGDGTGDRDAKVSTEAGANETATKEAGTDRGGKNASGTESGEAGAPRPGAVPAGGSAPAKSAKSAGSGNAPGGQGSSPPSGPKTPAPAAP